MRSQLTGGQNILISVVGDVPIATARMIANQRVCAGAANASRDRTWLREETAVWVETFVVRPVGHADARVVVMNPRWSASRQDWFAH